MKTNKSQLGKLKETNTQIHYNDTESDNDVLFIYK